MKLTWEGQGMLNVLVLVETVYGVILNVLLQYQAFSSWYINLTTNLQIFHTGGNREV